MKRKHLVFLVVGASFWLAVGLVAFGLAVDHASKTPVVPAPSALAMLFPDVVEGMGPAEVVDAIGRPPDRIENGPGATLSVWEYEEAGQAWSVVFTDGVVSAAFEGADSLAEEQARQGVDKTTTGSDGPYYAEDS